VFLLKIGRNASGNLGGFEAMTSTREQAAQYFSGREGARKFAFSKIWGDELHDVFSDVAPYYDVASNVASLGLCKTWRRKFVNSVEIRPGDEVLDLCAGTNAVGIALLRREPRARVRALDRSKEMQEVGGQIARDQGFEIESHIGDAHKLPFADESFDIVTLQWASRHLQVVEVFSEVRRVLKPGGTFYHCDMLRPENQIVRALYSAYLKFCVSATALIFRSGAAAWRCRDYFVQAIEMFYSTRELSEMLEHLGFTDVSSDDAIGGFMATHRARKPGPTAV
jgi:demethylmenaquinone methyltransferase/2-methoxy-6-polyprenyl-1,4-benzoquinol methylase